MSYYDYNDCQECGEEFFQPLGHLRPGHILHDFCDKCVKVKEQLEISDAAIADIEKDLNEFGNNRGEG